jgi:hypothetical protein
MSAGGGPDKPEQTEEERAAAARGAREFNMAVDTLVPVTDELTSRLKETASERERLGSEISLMAAEETGGDTARFSTAAARGVAPGSGRAVLTTGDLAQAGTDAVARGVAAGGQELDTKETRGRMQLGRAGRGIADASSALLTGVGRRKTQEAIARQKRELQQEAALVESAGSIAGAVTGKLNDSPDNKGLMHGAPDDLKGAVDVTDELSKNLAADRAGRF